MALGDIGLFNPAESAYTTPGAYDQLLRAEATKRASYLASMDQFYAELTESTRQFDETLKFKTTSLAQEAALTREGFASSEKTTGMNIKSQEKMNAEDIAFRKTQLESQERLSNRELDLKERELSIQEDVNSLSGEEQLLLNRLARSGSTNSGANTMERYAGGSSMNLDYSNRSSLADTYLNDFFGDLDATEKKLKELDYEH